MYPETPIDYASSKIISGVKNLRQGLDPDVLAYWYKRIEDGSIEIVPRHLKDKIHFEQDCSKNQQTQGDHKLLLLF